MDRDTTDPVLPAPDPPAGLPGRFRLGPWVGRGGSAEVYRVRDTRRGEDLALKVLVGAVVPDERLEAEARALARLAGTGGVVAVAAVGRTSDGAPWLAEEWVDGGTLAHRLRTRGPLPVAEVVAAARTLGAALAAAHALGVVHGDVAPGNVLVGGDGQLRLCDFGLASLVAGEGPAGGTPSFAAPERRAGAPPSPEADVFGLATVLWSAAVGALPPAPLPADLPRRLTRSILAARADDPVSRPTADRLARSSPHRKGPR